MSRPDESGSRRPRAVAVLRRLLARARGRRWSAYGALASIFGESFGIVLLEAMASGTPIVATNQGGISEVIKDGDNGIIVRKYRPDDMADAILTVLNDRKTFGRMSGECLASARRYDWSRVAGELESTYAN